MGLVCDRNEQGTCAREYDRPVARDDRDVWVRAAVAAEQTRVVVHRLQATLPGCQARIDYSRAQVTASRALLSPRPTG
jgi:hypothetical protein